MNKHASGLSKNLFSNPRRNIPLLIALVTLMLVAIMFGTRPELERRTHESYIPLARYIEVTPQTIRIPIITRGLINPENLVNLTAPVSGEVIFLSENFSAGSNFSKDETLMQIDPSQLKLELQQAQAKYDQARLNELEVLANLDAKSSVNRNSKLSELAKGTPQKAVAASNRAAAEAALELANKRLEFATLKAPFDGKVMKRTIELHEQLVAGRPYASIYANDAFIARLPVTREQLGFIATDNKPENNSDVVITSESGEQQWQGKIVRSEGYIAENRLIYVLAKIQKETSQETLEAGTSEAVSNSLDILPGSIITATIQGKPIENISNIPYSALREGQTVWLVSSENTLTIKPVDVLYRGKDFVYIKSGINSKDKVIINNIPSASDGMNIRASQKTENNKTP